MTPSSSALLLLPRYVSALNFDGDKLNNIQAYRLGDPTLPETNLGPVVSLASAERIRKQIQDAGTIIRFFDILDRC